jgi:hypothetical protein
MGMGRGIILNQRNRETLAITQMTLWRIIATLTPVAVISREKHPRWRVVAQLGSRSPPIPIVVTAL